MTDLLPDIRLRPNTHLPDYATRVVDYMAGTYNVGWPVLKSAAASTLMLAAERVSRQLEALPRIAAKTKSPGEASLVITFNYDLHVLGPCLSTVLLTAFALESFVRLGYYVALEHKRTRVQRRKGFDQLLSARLANFEEQRFADRTKALSRELKAPLLDKATLARCSDLIAYRNDCVHDSPLLWLGPQVTQRFQANRRTASNIDPRIGPYERLAMAKRPVRLQHAIRAIKAHDVVVMHFYRKASSEWVDDMKRLDSSLGNGAISDATTTTVPWSSIRTLADAWEQDGEAMGNVPIEQSEAFLLDLERRTKLRLE